MGHPISHSTHGGFSLPPAWAASVGVFLVCSAGALHSFALCAVGVGHIARHPGCFCIDGASWLAVAVGVANIWRASTISRRPTPYSPPSFLVAGFPVSTSAENRSFVMIEPIDASALVGVGHAFPVSRDDPDPVTLVRCPGMVRSEHSPLRIEPHRGQVSENDSEPPRSEHWRVLHEDEPGSNLANDPRHLHPEAGSLSFDPRSLAGGADVLAWKPARYDVNSSSPWPSVKAAHVIPDGKRRQCSVVLPCCKYACGVGVALDGADGAPSKQLAPEYSSTSARE